MSVIITLLLGWVALTGALAYLNLLNDFSRTPSPVGWLSAIALLISTTFAASPFGAVAARATPIAWLIGLQSFRMVVEILLHQGYLAGFVPPQMTWEGRNWDILTGLTAIPVACLAARKLLPSGTWLGSLCSSTSWPWRRSRSPVRSGTSKTNQRTRSSRNSPTSGCRPSSSPPLGLAICSYFVGFNPSSLRSRLMS